MRTYVVGLDGSEHAQAALDWAQSVAGPDDAIVVAHAWELPVVTGYETVPTVDPLTVEKVSEEFLNSTLTGRADPRITGHLVTGHPGRNLIDLADDAAAEGQEATIVVGHGGSSKASLLLGSTANYVIHHTSAAVVVVRGQLRLPVRRLAVGVDEGDRDDPDAHSLAALRWAANLPGVERIDVAHADFVPGVAAGPVREPGIESDAAVADDNRLLATVIDRATDGAGTPPNGAEIVPVVAAGTGAFALIEASREVDLVVIGTRGRRGLVELILGSTSLDVTAHAHCPVAVVH